VRYRFKGRHLLYLAVFIIAFIILPTGTPEDLVTTVLFIKVFGILPYLLMALITLLLVILILPKRYRKRLF
jgi:hypothetical protein